MADVPLAPTDPVVRSPSSVRQTGVIWQQASQIQHGSVRVICQLLALEQRWVSEYIGSSIRMTSAAQLELADQVRRGMSVLAKLVMPIRA